MSKHYTQSLAHQGRAISLAPCKPFYSVARYPMPTTESAIPSPVSIATPPYHRTDLCSPLRAPQTQICAPSTRACLRCRATSERTCPRYRAVMSPRACMSLRLLVLVRNRRRNRYRAISLTIVVDTVTVPLELVSDGTSEISHTEFIRPLNASTGSEMMRPVLKLICPPV